MSNINILFIDVGSYFLQARQPKRPAMWPEEFISAISSKAVDTGPDTTVQPNMLCSKCQPIRNWMEGNCDNTTELEVEQELQHHSTGSKLAEKSIKGCHLCTLIWHAFLWTAELSGVTRNGARGKIC